MDNNYVLGPNGELYHWGIKGMKWGVRRYQNKDGSLTKAGKERYKTEEEELKAREKVIRNKERAKEKMAKLEAKRAELDAREKALLEDPNKPKETPKKEEPKQETPKQENNRLDGKDLRDKKISEMTDAELNTLIERIKLEQNFEKLLSTPVEEVAKKEKDKEKKKLLDGRAITSDILTNSIKNIGTQTVTRIAGEGVNALAKKLFDFDGNFVNPAKGQKDK